MKKKKLKISNKTKKVLQKARRPEFTEEEIDEGINQINKKQEKN